MICALDASAMLAYLQQEPGWDQVDDLLSDADNECHAHAVNLCEVYYHVARQSDAPTARAAVVDLYTAGVIPRRELEDALWQDAGDIVALVRNTPGLALSLADAIALAFARHLGCELVSADHGEMDPLLPLGLCPVRFVR